jgi:hypothetical protein
VNSTHPEVFNDVGSNQANPNGIEAYGYVYQDNLGNFTWDGPTIVSLTAGGEAGVPDANPPPGWTTVGFWHTHPHQGGNVDPTQTQDGSHFSPADIDFATNSQLIMYVGVLDTLQSSTAENPQLRWYKYDPSTRSETLKNTVGSGGC